MSRTERHRIVIVGGGTAGIVAAARLKRAGHSDIAIIEPSDVHYYQPLWTLVGAGMTTNVATRRAEADYIPQGVAWIRERAAEIDPESHYVTTESGTRVGYDFLLVAPGLVLNWDGIVGLKDAIERREVSTNYSYELAPKTWEMIRNFRGGTALFHMPGTPVKCPGAPQKIMYLAADHFRRRGTLPSARVIFGSGLGGIYGVKEYAAVLNRVVERYGIDARYNHELVEIHADKKEAIFELKNDPARSRVTIGYDLLHVVPPQLAPAFVANSALAKREQPGAGWVEVDQYTMQHKRYANVFALGDVAGSPNAKTGAAAMKQAPVVVANLAAVIRGAEPLARYNGYVACPITTAIGRMLLCEFDYRGVPTPTIPFIDTMRERYDMWLLKRYGLPWMYWNVMLRGRDVPLLGARAVRDVVAPSPAQAAALHGVPRPPV